MGDLGFIVREIRKLSWLKNIPRTGWLQCGVPLAICESVAEHTYETSIIAYFLSRYLMDNGVKVDIAKVLTLSLFHDISEAITGDIPRVAKKYVRENVTALLEENFPSLANMVKRGGDLESKIVKIADNLSAYLQGLIYNKGGFKEASIISFSTLKDAEKIAKEEEDEKIRYLLLDFIGAFRESYKFE
ncbi:MAG: phosphohydrolase [Thermofilum sp. ex4484_15]|nr:MAG: phosphohydrolase [Thermofilum sp. ex4484_15]